MHACVTLPYNFCAFLAILVELVLVAGSSKVGQFTISTSQLPVVVFVDATLPLMKPGNARDEAATNYILQ